MRTINGQSVYLGQHVKTSQNLNCETSIIKKIDTENEAVFVVPLDGGHGGWYTANTVKSIN